MLSISGEVKCYSFMERGLIFFLNRRITIKQSKLERGVQMLILDIPTRRMEGFIYLFFMLSYFLVRSDTLNLKTEGSIPGACV